MLFRSTLSLHDALPISVVDLETGQERQLTQLPPHFNVRDFDVSPDGKEILVERVQDHADVVLIDLARRPGER